MPIFGHFTVKFVKFSVKERPNFGRPLNGRRVAEISQISREIRFECEIKSSKILTARFARFPAQKNHQNNHLFFKKKSLEITKRMKVSQSMGLKALNKEKKIKNLTSPLVFYGRHQFLS